MKYIHAKLGYIKQRICLFDFVSISDDSAKKNLAIEQIKFLKPPKIDCKENSLIIRLTMEEKPAS